MIALTFYIGARQFFASHLLIPRATLSAQIQAAEARRRDSGDDITSVPVQWQDWGPRGCLRLRLAPRHFAPILHLIPFGSRMPVVAFDAPAFMNASLYVFDVNPPTARHARQVLAARGDKSETTAIIEDIEEVLPGIVDPECSTIPYVAYRFKLPDNPRITSVVMSMTGFAVQYDGIEAEKALQTWTV